MEHELIEIFAKIEKRLAALEVIHTRYTGPKGPKGDKGDTGAAGRDGKDTTVTDINLLREQRNQITEEMNAFRRELHDYRTALLAEAEQLYRAYEDELAKIYCKEVDAIWEQRDKA